MRAAPPFEADVLRFGVWRAGTLALTVTVWVVLATWWWEQPAPAPAWVAAVAALGMLVAAAGALAAFRTPPLTLRRSAGQWHLSYIHASAEPSMRGDLLVALDLGAWLLLRFNPETGARRARWIAVQRRGLEPRWHALRCAVYAPRQSPLAEGAPVDV